MADRITLRGALAQQWLNSGALNVIADPAGNLDAPIYYDRVKKNNGYIFDENDRDLLIRQDPDHRPPFGIGVYTAKAPRRFVGSPKETEIGYYSSLGEADTLTVELAKPLTNGQVTVSFFYSDEHFAPEQLIYQPYYKGVPVYDPVTVTASDTGKYSKTNAGFFTFDLAGDNAGAAKFDKIVFSSLYVPNIQDGSDYLLESISGDGVPRLQISNTSAPNLVWPTRTYTFDYRETNIGNGDSPAHDTGFFLSTDETLDASDTLLGTVAEDPLLAGASRLESRSLTLPDNLAIGNYYLIYQTDVNNVVDEQNESNTAALESPLNTGAIRTEPIEVNGIVRKNFTLNYSTSTEQSIAPIGDFTGSRFLGIDSSGSDEAKFNVFGTDIGVRGSIGAKIGLESNLKVDGGTVNNASLPIDLWLDVPNKVQAGDSVTINSGFNLNQGASFSATGPTPSYTLNGIFGLNGYAQAFVGGYNTNLLPSFSIPETKANLLTLTPDNQDILFPLGPYGSVDLHLPNINSTGTVNNGVLSSEASDSFLEGSLNVSKLLIDVLNSLGVPVPRLEDSINIDYPQFLGAIVGVGANFISGNLNAAYKILSTTLNANLSLKQDLAVFP